MTTIHAQIVGNQALIPRDELEKLIQIAGQNAEVALQTDEDDLPTIGLMQLVEQSGSFDFWLEEGEDIYSAQDGEPV